MTEWNLDAVLRHPLAILLAGGLFTGVLAPFVVRGWEDRRRIHETKTELVTRITEAVTNLFMAVQFAQVGAASQTQEDFDAAYAAWQREQAILTSLLIAYFRDPAVETQWLRCKALATTYYVQSGIHDEDARTRYLHQVALGLWAHQPPLDLSEGGTVQPGVALAADAPDLTDVSVLRRQIQLALAQTVKLVIDARAQSG